MKLLIAEVVTILCLSMAPVGEQGAGTSRKAQSTSNQLITVKRAAEQTDTLPELEHLCHTIGPRLTGSPAATEAERDVLSSMRRIGLQQVHAETWTLPRAWQRGRALAFLMESFRLPIPIAAYGWTGSTPAHTGLVPVVLVDADEITDHFDSLVKAQGSNWSGKVLLVSSKPQKPMRAYAQLLPLLEAATKVHAIAVFRHDTRPGNGMVHAEPSAFPLPETIHTHLVSALDLPLEHQQLLESLLRAGRPVLIDIDVENSFSSGPVTSSNLVGEITGTTHPEQVVLLGAHLDSWDLGTGAMDDGFGVGAVLGAAESLLRSDLRPARTLRFVIFGGEEEGLLGSRAYVRQHQSEMANILAAFALDWGAGPIVKLPTAGHSELVPLLSRFNELAPELHLQPPDDGYLFMTDGYAFTLAGVPGIAPLIQSPDYAEQVHSVEDTFDKINPAHLRQAMTVLAMVSFFLGETPEVPGTQFTRAQTASALIQGHQKPLLEALNLWTF